MLLGKSFKIYIQRLSKSKEIGNNISRKASDCIDIIVRVIASKVSQDTRMFTQSSDRKTINLATLEAALKCLLEGECEETTLNYAHTAVDAFSKTANVKYEKAVMRETRAGITFSVSLCEKYLRDFDRSSFHLSSEAPVFLAGALESVALDLLSIASNVTRDDRKTNITVRHVYLAIQNDPLWKNLVNRLNIVLLESGTVPYIHPKLLERKPIRRPTRADKDQKKRCKPGHFAVREIRNYQKSIGLITQRAPFERLVREEASRCSKSVNNLRFTQEFMNAFQNLVEQEVVKMLQAANELSCYNSRETVQDKDVSLVVKLLNLPDGDGKAETDIPIAAITKLSYRAGIKRLGKAKEKVKEFFVNVVKNYIPPIIIATELEGRMTVNTKFLLEGMKTKGINVATVPEKRHVRKKVESDKEETKELPVVEKKEQKKKGSRSKKKETQPPPKEKEKVRKEKSVKKEKKSRKRKEKPPQNVEVEEELTAEE